MKKYLYLAIAAICLGLSACSSDDDDEPKQLEQKKTGEENITDPAVTGGVQEVYLEGDDRNVAISAKIVGYLNLSDTLKLAIGMAPVYGVEMSTNESFPENETHQFSAKRMDDNRKFTITATGLKENTTYYYRTYLTNTIFGKTERFTTESYEAVAAKMLVPTADATNVRENSASVAVSEIRTGVAYTTDKSLLTAANLKKAAQGNAVNGLSLSKDGHLTELASGTTYYYCEFLKLATYIILGEVKSFTTSGYNAQDLAKQMTINASLNEATQMWNVSIQSSLANSLQGKNIRYDIGIMMRSSYSTYDYDKIEVGWLWSDERGEVNATGNANSYQATLENPFYNKTIGIDEYGSEHTLENWYSQWWEDTDFWHNVAVARELRAKIEANIADEDDKKIYEYCIGTIESAFNNRCPRYSSYVKCYLQVFVEIDGKRYVVKEVEGKTRVPRLEDNPLFNYSDIFLN
jgi:hypothetical protein